MFSSKGRLFVRKLTVAVDPTPPLGNPHPAGTAKGCLDVARDILVAVLASHNTVIVSPVQGL